MHGSAIESNSVQANHGSSCLDENTNELVNVQANGSLIYLHNSRFQSVDAWVNHGSSCLDGN